MCRNTARHVIALATAPLLIALISSASAQSTFAKLRADDALTCGLVTEQADYGKEDTHGDLTEFNLEFCKAVAAAVLGSAEKVKSHRYPDEQSGLAALVSGGIDMLAGVTPSASRSGRLHISFTPPTFFDGLGFLVPNRGSHSLADLVGRQVCYVSDTESEARFLGVMQSRGLAILPYPWEEAGEMVAALVSGHCAAIAGDISQLAQQRSGLHGLRGAFDILPETITLDPIAAATRQDDPQWTSIVTWTLAALIEAEASGVTKSNVAKLKGSDDQYLRRLLGKDHSASSALDLPDDWVVTVVTEVGNYGEIFANTIGPGSRVDLPRGVNALWTQGGLIYPLPHQ